MRTKNLVSGDETSLPRVNPGRWSLGIVPGVPGNQLEVANKVGLKESISSCYLSVFLSANLEFSG